MQTLLKSVVHTRIHAHTHFDFIQKLSKYFSMLLLFTLSFSSAYSQLICGGSPCSLTQWCSELNVYGDDAAYHNDEKLYSLSYDYVGSAEITVTNGEIIELNGSAIAPTNQVWASSAGVPIKFVVRWIATQFVSYPPDVQIDDCRKRVARTFNKGEINVKACYLGIAGLCGCDEETRAIELFQASLSYTYIDGPDFISCDPAQTYTYQVDAPLGTVDWDVSGGNWNIINSGTDWIQIQSNGIPQPVTLMATITKGKCKYGLTKSLYMTPMEVPSNLTLVNTNTPVCPNSLVNVSVTPPNNTNYLTGYRFHTSTGSFVSSTPAYNGIPIGTSSTQTIQVSAIYTCTESAPISLTLPIEQPPTLNNIQVLGTVCPNQTSPFSVTPSGYSDYEWEIIGGNAYFTDGVTNLGTTTSGVNVVQVNNGTQPYILRTKAKSNNCNLWSDTKQQAITPGQAPPMPTITHSAKSSYCHSPYEYPTFQANVDGITNGFTFFWEVQARLHGTTTPYVTQIVGNFTPNIQVNFSPAPPPGTQIDLEVKVSIMNCGTPSTVAVGYYLRGTKINVNDGGFNFQCPTSSQENITCNPSPITYAQPGVACAPGNGGPGGTGGERVKAPGDGEDPIDGITTTQKISLYPNPAHQEINVEGLGTERQLLEIFHTNGKLMNRYEVSEDRTKIPTHAIPSGLYILRISSENKSSQHKFQVIH